MQLFVYVHIPSSALAEHTKNEGSLAICWPAMLTTNAPSVLCCRATYFTRVVLSVVVFSPQKTWSIVQINEWRLTNVSLFLLTLKPYTLSWSDQLHNWEENKCLKPSIFHSYFVKHYHKPLGCLTPVLGGVGGPMADMSAHRERERESFPFGFYGAWLLFNISTLLWVCLVNRSNDRAMVAPSNVSLHELYAPQLSNLLLSCANTFHIFLFSVSTNVTLKGCSPLEYYATLDKCTFRTKTGTKVSQTAVAELVVLN